MRLDAVAAVTVAVRWPSSIRATSPKCEPGPSVLRSSPCEVTLASPDSITKKPTPCLPSSAITSPAL